jgi:hypothetical protein
VYDAQNMDVFFCVLTTLFLLWGGHCVFTDDDNDNKVGATVLHVHKVLPCQCVKEGEAPIV